MTQTQSNEAAPRLTDPPENPESTPFYDAAAEGRFIGRRCTDCGRFHWYPRPICPFCRGATEWAELSPAGTVYSYSVSRRSRPPYAIAYVTLDDGPRMLTNLVNCDLDGIGIGQRVRLRFVPTVSGRQVPCFEPDPGSRGDDGALTAKVRELSP